MNNLSLKLHQQLILDTDDIGELWIEIGFAYVKQIQKKYKLS